jgi:two-component sensor histidine kinase
MRLRPSDIPSLTGLRIASPLVAAIVILLTGVISWQNAIEGAEAEAKSRARLLESQVAGLTSAQFVIHDAISVRLAEIDRSEVQGRPFHVFLKALFETTAQTYGIGLVAPDGRLLASSGEYPATSRIEGRDYLDKLSRGADRFVDRILLETGQVDAMVSATKVTVGDTSATLVTAWPVEALTDYTAGLADRAGHQALVARADGRIIVPSVASGMTDLPMADLMQTDRPAHSDGALHTLAAPDGQVSLLAYRAVPGAPLLVAYAMSTRSIRAEWLMGILPFWTLAAAAGVFGFVLFGTIREDAATRLRRAIAEERATAAEALARHRQDLLREMTHRIKNNLTIISAIIRVEGRGKSPVQLVDLAGRIDAVASLHDMLYRADDGATADLGKLIEAIATNPAIVPSELGIDVSLDVLPGVPLDSSVATTVAMLVSEIITNSVKHAFVGATDPRLSISMTQTGSNLEITVRDNGTGTPVETARRSGTELMLALASSAGISVTAEVDGGTVHRLHLPRPAIHQP